MKTLRVVLWFVIIGLLPFWAGIVVLILGARRAPSSDDYWAGAPWLLIYVIPLCLITLVIAAVTYVVYVRIRGDWWRKLIGAAACFAVMSTVVLIGGADWVKGYAAKHAEKEAHERAIEQAGRLLVERSDLVASAAPRGFRVGLRFSTSNAAGELISLTYYIYSPDHPGSEFYAFVDVTRSTGEPQLQLLCVIAKRDSDQLPANSDVCQSEHAIVKRADAPLTADISARTTFRELRRCVFASKELAIARRLADAQNRADDLEQVLSHCDQADLGRRYFEATEAAAKDGDADAQLCYLQRDFSSPEGAPIFTDAEIDEYQKAAPAYVDAALKRGDWRVVDLLNTGHLLHVVGERYDRYKSTKLLRLGASGSYAEGLDDVLRGIVQANLNPAAAMTEQAIKEGDAWAKQTYANYFSSVPGLTGPPVVCRPDFTSTQ
jgi:hypothetical protein